MAEVTSFGPSSWIGRFGAQSIATAKVGENGAGVNVQKTLPNGGKRNLNAGGLSFGGGFFGLGSSSNTVQPDGSTQDRGGGLLITPYGLAGAQGQKTTAPDGSSQATGRFGLGAVVDGLGVGLLANGSQTVNTQTGTTVTDTHGRLGVIVPGEGVLGGKRQTHRVDYADGSSVENRQGFFGATNGTDAFGLNTQANIQKTADGTTYDHRQLGFNATFSNAVLVDRNVAISSTGRIQGTLRGPMGISIPIDRQSLDPKYWGKRV